MPKGQTANIERDLCVCAYADLELLNATVYDFKETDHNETVRGRWIKSSAVWNLHAMSRAPLAVCLLIIEFLTMVSMTQINPNFSGMIWILTRCVRNRTSCIRLGNRYTHDTQSVNIRSLTFMQSRACLNLFFEFIFDDQRFDSFRFWLQCSG